MGARFVLRSDVPVWRRAWPSQSFSFCSERRFAMLRLMFAVTAVLLACAVTLTATQNQVKKDVQSDTQIKKDQAEMQSKATISNVDVKNHTVTVKMKDKEGKDRERTFKLTEDIRYFDSTGKAVALDVFRSGHLVLIVEREGMLKELRQEKDQTDKNAPDLKKSK
jgi:hypothetical protein